MMRINCDDHAIHDCFRLTVRALRLAAHDPDADVRYESRKALQDLAVKATNLPPGSDGLVDAYAEDSSGRRSPAKRPGASSYPVAKLVRILQERRQASSIPIALPVAQ